MNLFVYLALSEIIKINFIAKATLLKTTTKWVQGLNVLLLHWVTIVYWGRTMRAFEDTDWSYPHYDWAMVKLTKRLLVWTSWSLWESGLALPYTRFWSQKELNIRVNKELMASIRACVKIMCFTKSFWQIFYRWWTFASRVSECDTVD